MKTLYIALLGVFLNGCVATNTLQTPNYQKIIFSPPAETILNVNTGNDLFVEGAFIPGEVINLDKPIDLMIPGAMFIPFPVHIKGPLKLARISAEWKYFCGDIGNVAASFPGLGSVIRDGDCVGIRVSNSNQKQWVVDNSIYNRGRTTVWTLDISDSEARNITTTKIAEPFMVETLRKITFDGFHSKQIHFTWTEIQGNNKNTQKFTFDYMGRPTKIGVKGYKLEVVEVDNIKLTYKWIKD